MKSKFYLMVIGFLFSLSSHAEVNMCRDKLEMSISEAVAFAVDQRAESAKIVRVDLASYSSMKIDSFMSENMADKNFAGFIFRFEKTTTDPVLKHSDKFQPVITFEERSKLFHDTLSEAHSARMNYVSELEKKKTLAEYPKLTKSGDMYKFLGVRGNIDGVIFFMDMDYLDETVKLLAWVWKAKEIDQNDSNQFDNQIKNLLFNYPVPVLASVEKQNLRSINFHRKLGFKEKWLMFRFY